MEIELGSLSDDLQSQIERAGCEYCGKVPLEILEKSAKAVSLLYIRGYISNSQATQARKRIVRDIKVIKIQEV